MLPHTHSQPAPLASPKVVFFKLKQELEKANLANKGRHSKTGKFPQKKVVVKDQKSDKQNQFEHLSADFFTSKQKVRQQCNVTGGQINGKMIKQGQKKKKNMSGVVDSAEGDIVSDASQKVTATSKHLTALKTKDSMGGRKGIGKCKNRKKSNNKILFNNSKEAGIQVDRKVAHGRMISASLQQQLPEQSLSSQQCLCQSRNNKSNSDDNNAYNDDNNDASGDDNDNISEYIYDDCHRKSNQWQSNKQNDSLKLKLKLLNKTNRHNQNSEIQAGKINIFPRTVPVEEASKISCQKDTIPYQKDIQKPTFVLKVKEQKEIIRRKKDNSSSTIAAPYQPSPQKTEFFDIESQLQNVLYRQLDQCGEQQSQHLLQQHIQWQFQHHHLQKASSSLFDCKNQNTFHSNESKIIVNLQKCEPSHLDHRYNYDHDLKKRIVKPLLFKERAKITVNKKQTTTVALNAAGAAKCSFTDACSDKVLRRTTSSLKKTSNLISSIQQHLHHLKPATSSSRHSSTTDTTVSHFMAKNRCITNYHEHNIQMADANEEKKKLTYEQQNYQQQYPYLIMSDCGMTKLSALPTNKDVEAKGNANRNEVDVEHEFTLGQKVDADYLRHRVENRLRKNCSCNSQILISQYIKKRTKKHNKGKIQSDKNSGIEHLNFYQQQQKQKKQGSATSSELGNILSSRKIYNFNGHSQKQHTHHQQSQYQKTLENKANLQLRRNSSQKQKLKQQLSQSQTQLRSQQQFKRDELSNPGSCLDFDPGNKLQRGNIKVFKGIHNHTNTSGMLMNTQSKQHNFIEKKSTCTTADKVLLPHMHRRTQNRETQIHHINNRSSEGASKSLASVHTETCDFSFQFQSSKVISNVKSHASIFNSTASPSCSLTWCRKRDTKKDNVKLSDLIEQQYQEQLQMSTSTLHDKPFTVTKKNKSSKGNNTRNLGQFCKTLTPKNIMSKTHCLTKKRCDWQLQPHSVHCQCQKRETLVTRKHFNRSNFCLKNRQQRSQPCRLLNFKSLQIHKSSSSATTKQHTPLTAFINPKKNKMCTQQTSQHSNRPNKNNFFHIQKNKMGKFKNRPQRKDAQEKLNSAAFSIVYKGKEYKNTFSDVEIRKCKRQFM